MKKFSFPLRSVATIRSLRENQARQAFALAVQGYTAAEEYLAETRRRLADLRQILMDARRVAFRSRDQVAFLNAFQLETLRETEAGQRVKLAKGLMDRRRDEWLNCRKNVRVMENLENKAREDYRQELDRELQHELDDLVRQPALSRL